MSSTLTTRSSQCALVGFVVCLYTVVGAIVTLWWDWSQNSVWNNCTVQCGVHTALLQRCGTEVWYWSVVQRCSTEVWYRGVLQRCGTEVWYRSVVQRCGTEVLNTTVLFESAVLYVTLCSGWTQAWLWWGARGGKQTNFPNIFQGSSTKYRKPTPNWIF